MNDMDKCLLSVFREAHLTLGISKDDCAFLLTEVYAAIGRGVPGVDYDSDMWVDIEDFTAMELLFENKEYTALKRGKKA